MDEEQPKKKITLNNFFESIQSADSKADRALRKNTSNLDLIDKNKSLIEGLIKSLKDIKSEVELIQKNISVNKDIEEDKLFAQEDQEQKIRRLERLQGIEGDKVDPAEAAAGTTDDSDFKKKAADTVKKALQDRGVMSIIVGLIGVNLASMLQNKRSFFGGMADFATGNLFDFDDKGRGLTPILPEVQEKLRQKPRGYGRIFGGIADYIMRDSTDFDKRGGNRPQNLNLGGEVKDNDNDTSNNDEDSVPAILPPGEFVVTKDAVDKIGVDTLKGLNASVGATNEPTKIPKEEKKYTMGYRRGQITPTQLVVSSTKFIDQKTQKRMGGQGGRALGSTTKRQGGDTFESKSLFGENYAGISKRTTTSSLDYIPGGDGVRDSNLKTKKTMEKDMVSVAVEDIMEHQDDLLKRIRKVKGYENVTIEDVLNSNVDMDKQKYARIIGHSDAAKSTQKKKGEARKLDKE